MFYAHQPLRNEASHEYPGVHHDQSWSAVSWNAWQVRAPFWPIASEANVTQMACRRSAWHDVVSASATSDLLALIIQKRRRSCMVSPEQ